MPTFVFVCIAKKATGNGKRIPRAKRVAEGDALAGVGTGSVEKSPFSASYRLCSWVLICTPQNRVFPFSSPLRIRFIRSHRPHAAPNKYSPFLKVVLVWVSASKETPKDLIAIRIALNLPCPFHNVCKLSRNYYSGRWIVRWIVFVQRRGELFYHCSFTLFQRPAI